jgi:hypothetical protein
MESNDVTADPSQAAAQLAALRTDRAAMAERVRPPWWYDPALGLLVFAAFASISTRNAWVIGAAVAVFLAGLWRLKRAYQRITGLWVSGTREGATQRAIGAWAALYAAVLGLSLYAEFSLGWRGGMAVGGAVLGIGITLIGRWWTALYVAELREQA